MINPTGGSGFSHHRLLDVRHSGSPISLSILPCDDPFRKLHPSSLDIADSKHQKVAETSLYAWRTRMVMPSIYEVWEHISRWFKMEIVVAGSLCYDVAKNVCSHFKTMNPQIRSPPLFPYTYSPSLLSCLFKTSASLHDEEMYSQGLIILDPFRMCCTVASTGYILTISSNPLSLIR